MGNQKQHLISTSVTSHHEWKVLLHAVNALIHNGIPSFTSLLKKTVLQIFIDLETPLASDAFEPENLAIKQ
jgi:hypothetical protein